MKSTLHARVALRVTEMMRALAQAEVMAENSPARRDLLDKARKYNGAISRILLEPGKGTRVSGRKKSSPAAPAAS